MFREGERGEARGRAIGTEALTSDAANLDGLVGAQVVRIKVAPPSGAHHFVSAVDEKCRPNGHVAKEHGVQLGVALAVHLEQAQRAVQPGGKQNVGARMKRARLDDAIGRCL